MSSYSIILAFVHYLEAIYKIIANQDGDLWDFLHQQRLEQVQSAKYLGITIRDDLDWGQHISEISSKATKTMGFLWCNLAFAPWNTKEIAYKTLVRPQLEYAAPIWHLYHEMRETGS